MLISEYNFAVNDVMVIDIAVHKILIIHDLVSKLLITKVSLAKISTFQCFSTRKSVRR